MVAAGHAIGVLRDWLALRLTREAEHGRLFLWSPVAVMAGILVYFALPNEPAIFIPGSLLALSTVAAIGLRRSAVAGLTLTGLALVSAGMFAAKLRTERVMQPVLWKKHGPVIVEGMLRQVERRARGVRLTIDLRSLAGIDDARRPAQVQVTWRGAGGAVPRPGDRVRARVILMPPPGPVAPGAYHYGRDLFFRGIGATGFVIGRPVFSAEAGRGIHFRSGIAVERFRQAVTARIGAALPGEKGALAAALLSGERGEISEVSNAALRASGLAHILSISGMHMSLFAVTLYWLVRFALAAVPFLALRYPIRAWAASVGLAGAAFYLVLSGGGVPAERSWIMVSIMFLALIVGRPALTMRNVALAALIILVLQPESVLSASFQLSFAATVALIAAYETAAGRFWASHPRGVMLLPFRYTLGLAATSLVAGVATGVFGAYHFNTITTYGLFGNLLAMPILGIVVMPSGMIGLAMMPLGLEAGPLWLMGLGLSGVMAVAQMVASWPGAVIHTHGLTSEAALIAGFAGLWLCLWRERWRLAGLAILPFALAAGSPERPDVLIEADGRTVAVRGEAGRLVIAGLRSGRFAAGRWLESEADPRNLSDPSLKEGLVCDAQGCRVRLQGGGMAALVLDASGLAHWCARASIVVTPATGIADCTAQMMIDGAALTTGGAHALSLQNGAVTIRTALAPHRPWDRWALEAASDVQRNRSATATPPTQESRGDSNPAESEPSHPGSGVEDGNADE